LSITKRAIYIGRKPLMQYVEAILRVGSGKATILARGGLIAKAVNVALGAKRYGRMVGRNVEIGRIEIDSEIRGDKQISVIKIEVELE